MAKIAVEADSGTLTHRLVGGSNINRFLLLVVAISLLAGVGTGYLLSGKSAASAPPATLSGQSAKSAQEDTRTFRDFAEGTVKARPAAKDPNEYVEGTHLLERPGQVPVALTSSVVDLSQYEGKKVKVFGETQKALKEGWLMDVGKVEVE